MDTPQDITEEEMAARHAGWNLADGPAPYEHALEPADAQTADAKGVS